MKIFEGDREEWLKKYVYVQTDFSSDDFATNIEYVTVEDKIKLGYKVEEPKFVEKCDLPFN